MKRKRFTLISGKTKPDKQEQKYIKEIKTLQAEVHNTLLESIKRLEV